MAQNKLEIVLTPQNDEWIKLIPNQTQNLNIVFNKLIDAAIGEGLLLEVISQALTISDLSKFKTSYARIQSKRAEYMADLEITPPHIERRKVVQTQSIEIDEEDIIPEDIKPVSTQSAASPKKEKKISHGFDESVF